jgi:argininosuccinate lyase
MTNQPRHPFEGRLGPWPDERLKVILAKRVESQRKYLPAQLQMDMAHTVMLAEQGIVSDTEAAAILGVLRSIERDGLLNLGAGAARSSLFWYVEATLIERLGEQVGGKMHTGRSHNDIMPTVSRITARERILTLLDGIAALQDALIQVAGEHITTVMPGYTALQHGQPWTFGHYLSGWVYAFGRDVVRLQNAYRNTNQSSLGASALAGTSWPLDRDRTASLLGFDHVLPNSRDAGFATRDYVAETIAAITIAMNNVSTLCSDLYLWSSFEFGMSEMADGFSGTSSFMPQKKNAWAVDWARGAAGSMVGAFASSIAAMRGSSSTDGSAQDYPERPLADAFDLAIDYVTLIAGVVGTLSVDVEKMLERATANWTTASNLADTIAREADLSFRAAHGIVGRVVRTAIANGISPLEIRGQDIDRAASDVVGHPIGVSDQLVAEALDPTRFVQTRVTAGSVHPDEVRAMLAASASDLHEERLWLADQRQHLQAAHDSLEIEVDGRTVSADESSSARRP